MNLQQFQHFLWHLHERATENLAVVPPSLWAVSTDVARYIPNNNEIQLGLASIQTLARPDVPFEHVVAFTYYHELGHWHDHRVRGNNPARDLHLKETLRTTALTPHERAERYATMPSERYADQFALRHLNADYGTNYTSRFQLLNL